MSKRNVLIGVAFMLCLGVSAASAHHSPAAYDLTKSVTIKGEVKSYRWANPHVYIYVVAREADGRTSTWKVEGGWPGVLVSLGWSRDTLKPGDHVEVIGAPARNPANKAMMGMSLKRDSGPALVLNEMPGAPVNDNRTPKSNREGLVAASALAGTWLPLNADPRPVIFPSPLLTAKGKALAATSANAAAGGVKAANCEPQLPPMNMSFPGVKGFEARSGDIVIRPAVDSDVERLVHMNQTAHDSGSEDQEGHSIGHWERDVLIVDTVFNVEDRAVVTGVPSQGATHLVERFALSKDRNQLEYSFSVENPEYLTKPLTYSATWVFRPDIQVPHLACDADVARSFLED